MKILLTATVTPQVTEDLHIRDAEVRRQQYARSLVNWAQAAIPHRATVVLFENSGEDLGRLAVDTLGRIPANLRLVNARPPIPEDIDRGKGATEAAMMDEFADAFFEDPDELWVKCTGRLYVRNFNRCLLSRAPQRVIVGRTTLDFRLMDTRLFAASASAWRDYFMGAGPFVSDRHGVFLEHVLVRRILSAMGDGVPLLRFGAKPDFLGRSGTQADGKYDSLPNRIKRIGMNKLEDALKGRLAAKQY